MSNRMSPDQARVTAKVAAASETKAPAGRARKPVAKSLTKADAGVKAAPPAADASKVKHKLVRDSFTMPKGEYAVLEILKQRAASLARFVKKGELLRAGIGALNAMNDKAFLAALNGVPSLKTGRPKLESASRVPPPA